MNQRVLVDANILLDLYSYPSTELDTIDKIINDSDFTKYVSFYFTTIFIDEWKRNRAVKIRASLNEFKKYAIVKFGEPTIIRSSDKYTTYSKAKKDFLDIAQEIYDTALSSALSHDLFADKIISYMIEHSVIIPDDNIITDDIIKLAYHRMLLGNPPGKKGELGDRITWELLLKYLDDGDLFILSADKDYASELWNSNGNDCSDENIYDDVLLISANEFLRNEWEKKKRGKLFLISKLRCLFELFSSNTTKRFLFIRAREKAVERLANSKSFKETHRAISELSSYNDFTKSELLQLLYTYLNNDQIYRIISDKDVLSFGSTLLNLLYPYSSEENVKHLYTKLQDVISKEKGEANIDDIDWPDDTDLFDFDEEDLPF